MPIKLQGTLVCEYCFSPLKRRERCACGVTRQSEARHPSVLALGTELARRYVVGHVLGKGGFGVTYLCYDKLLHRRVAIKEYMPKDLAYRDGSSPRISSYNEEQLETFRRGASRFVEEAETVRLFNGNPNIISVYENFEENNTVYYVMEYLDGCDLRGYMKRCGLLSEAQAVDMAAQAAAALAIIHSRRILHRDISPDNIFVCGGDIKLIDFGAAKQVLGYQSQTLSMVLKQGFAPVEQYQTRGRQQGPWTDLYALGATMYYCVSGCLPPDAMSRVTSDSVDMSGFSPAFAALLTKTMAMKPEERFQSAADFIRALEALPREPLSGDGHRHRFIDTVTSPGCTTQGFTTHVCACGETFVDSYLPPTGHDWGQWSEVRQSDGSRLRARKCAACGAEEYETAENSAHTHSFNAVLTPPTCTERGYTTHVCACGFHFSDMYTSPLGHLWSRWHTVRQISSDMEGLRERICRRCGESQSEKLTTYRPSGDEDRAPVRREGYDRAGDYEDFT